VKNSKQYIYIITIASMLFWGMAFIWMKIVLQYYQPITVATLRIFLSSIFLLFYIKLFKKCQKIDKSDYKLFLISAFFNPFIYFLLESYGIKYVSPTISAVIIATIPLFSPLVAYFSVKEKLSLLNIFGIIVSFFGILIMLVNKDLSLRADPIGVLILFLAVASALIYTVLLVKLTRKYSSVNIITYQNIIGIFYFLPLFFYFDFNNFISVKPNFELISSLVFLSILCSSLAFIFYATSIKNLGISKTNVFTNFIPVFAAIFSYFILAEVFTFSKILGIVIVIVGVFVSQIKKYKKPQRND
jgi:drug/metabolite transporter (DMT)-like permease